MPAAGEMLFANPLDDEIDSKAVPEQRNGGNSPSRLNAESDSDDEDEDTDPDDAQNNAAGRMSASADMFAVLRAKTGGESANEHVDEREVKKQLALKYMHENRIISPDGTFRKRWDGVQIFLLAYVAIVVPYR